MPIFAAGIPRLITAVVAVAAFSLVAPEAIARGPELCLWRNLFRLSACPACGTLRALAAFFHGRFTEALNFNRNVVITAPALLAILLTDTLHGLRKLVSS